MFSWQIVWIGMAAFWSQTGHVTSHGRLIQPPQRLSAWRFGYDVPTNYNDNQLFCGGSGVQWNAVNDGRCGVCGDPFNAAIKPNEDINGKYVKNVITGSYVKGDVLATKVNITAYHRGWFEFRLCPLATPNTKVTQACLNQTLLRVAGSNTSRIILADIKNGTGIQVYEINLQLPSTITCERCVLQWKYNTGNSWGCESPKGCCLGCGKQENFVNCADIKIADVQTTTESSSSSSQSATMTALTSSTTLQSSTSTSQTTSTTSSSTSTSSTPSSSTSSVATSSTISSPPSTTPSTSSVTTSSSSTPSTSAATTSQTTNLESSSSSTNSQTSQSSSSSSSATTSPPSTTSPTTSVTTSSSSTPSTSAATTSQTTNLESSSSSTNSQTSQSSSSSSSATTVSTSTSGLPCTAVTPYSLVPGMVAWCNLNCASGYCPPSHCLCTNN